MTSTSPPPATCLIPVAPRWYLTSPVSLTAFVVACFPSNSSKIVAYGLLSVCARTLIRPRCAIARSTSRARGRPRLDRDIEHWHQDVAALDGEPLVALIRASEKALESINIGESMEQGFLLFVAEWGVQAATFDLLPQPLALFDFAEVRNLESDLRRIKLAETCDDIGCAAARCTERDSGDARQVIFAQSVEFERQLRRSLRRGAERV